MSSALLTISFSVVLSLSYTLFASSHQSSFSSKTYASITSNNFSVVNDSSLPFLPESNPTDPFLLYILRRSGYIAIPNTDGARMLYYFFDNRSPDNSPVMLWLTGVPGLTCSISLFRENGPFRIRQDLSLEGNDFGWDKEVNMIYVDELGAGYSYIKSDDIRHNQDSLVADLYNFLLAFFEKHHAFKDNDFYIAGQSYAGKYAPALAARIHGGNKEKPNLTINLVGVAVGNGFTNPKKQYSATFYYADDKERNLIKEDKRQYLKTLSNKCISSAKTCDENLSKFDCEKAYDVCDSLVQGISESAQVNIYDVRKPKSLEVLNYDFSDVHNLMNQEAVKRHLDVGTKSFKLFNSEIYDAMKEDYMKNAENDVLALLKDGTNLLIYAGNCDMLCSSLGNMLWVNTLDFKWDNESETGVTYSPFMLNQETRSGAWRLYGPLAFLDVYNAGHMVGMDQPEVAYEMLKRWMQYIKNENKLY